MIESIALLSVAASTMSTTIDFNIPVQVVATPENFLDQQYSPQGLTFTYSNAVGWAVTYNASSSLTFFAPRSGAQAAYFEGEVAGLNFSSPQATVDFWVAVETTTVFQARATPAIGSPTTFVYQQTLAAGQWHHIVIQPSSGLIGQVALLTLADGQAGQVRFAIDDLSFTIPTMSSAGALAAGGLALLRRQRR